MKNDRNAYMTTPYHPPVALRWNRVACEAIYHTKTPPILAARALAMVHTAMYDAWASFNEGACVNIITVARPEEERDAAAPKDGF
jgi:hypothetical protein